MGKGGYSVGSKSSALGRQPTEKPPFTIGTLKKAVPPHCFERSLLKSSAYLLVDLLAVITLFTAISKTDGFPFWAQLILLPFYWFFQGAVCTGIWVIAHECGHQAFSKWQAVNDSVGLVLHSCLLVPYFSWKHSHRRHHSNTGSAEKDEVFVPVVKDEIRHVDHFELRSLGPYRVLELAVVLTLGWPTYLVANISGREYDGWANHFSPYSPIYSRRERKEVVISDIALCAAFAGLYALGKSFGWIWLVKVYVVPYLIVNFWLVMITLLQHTHPGLPHYRGEEWDWLRGALSTVDRSYGFLDHFFHHIADTHVSHHLFSQMPHYHAQEATKALIPVLGKFYARDNRNVFRGLWEDWDACRYVAPDTKGSNILWFHT